MEIGTPTDLNAPAKYKIDKGFYESPEYKNIPQGRPVTMAFKYSPYFGMAKDGGISYTDDAYRAYAKRMGFNPDADFVAKTTGSTNTGNTNMAQNFCSGHGQISPCLALSTESAAMDSICWAWGAESAMRHALRGGRVAIKWTRLAPQIPSGTAPSARQATVLN